MIAATSDSVMIHSTARALSTMPWVRGWRPTPKYEETRLRSDLALPT